MDKIKIHRAWERENKIAYVHRDKTTGKKKISTVKFDWWFYVKTADIQKHKQVFDKHLNSKNIKKIENEGKYSRIYVDRKHNSDFLDKNMEYCWEFKDWNLNSITKDLEMLDIQTYEKDILPHKRWIMQDNVEIESDYKVLYYDIETDDRSKGKIEVGAERILSFAVLDEQTGKSKFICIKEDTDEEEKRILLILAKLINKYDVLIGFNSSNFDDPYIKARFMRYGIVIDWRKILLQDHLKIFKVYGQKLTSYTLDNIAFEICGERKVEHLEGYFEMWQNNRKLFKKYNLKDVELMYQIEQNTKYLAVARDVNIIGKCTVDDVYITRKIDNMMVMSAQKRKHYHFKTKVKSDEEFAKFKGAVVFEPKAGLYDDVKVLDFSSLYPNSIKTCNISPDTLITDENRNEVPDDKIITTITGAKFRKDFIGILPELIMSMKSKRDYYKGLLAKCTPNTVEHKTNDRLQYVYKSFGLSFYGAIGETHSRFYDVAVAEAVTQTGVYFNKICAKYVERKGSTVIYGDSVTAERCTMVDINGEIITISFEELYEITDIKTEERGKEFGGFINPIYTLSYNFETKRRQWKQIDVVIRHKTDKQIYKYFGKYGNTTITADHSLIDKSGNCFKPTDNTFNDFSITSDEIINEKPYIEPIEYDGYVYDLSVRDNHNFVDAENNILLHNTDSSFIHGLNDKDVEPIIKQLAKLCRKHAFEKFNSDECTMVMDYDKGFRKILMQNVKKRYAGYITYLDGHYLDEEKLYVAGLEYKRTDNCQYVRDKQYELIQMLLQKETPSLKVFIDWISECKTDIFEHKVKAEDLMFSVRLTKEIEDYAGRQLNKLVAEQMIKDGKEMWVGDKMIFFIESVNEKQQPNPLPSYRWKGKYNEMYYWNKKVFPPLERVLATAFPNYDWKLYYVKGSKMNVRLARKMLW